MKRQHAVRVFLVLDPAQDYDESTEVWGVFGSLAAAQYATRRLRVQRLGRGYYDNHRDTEVQEWHGDQLANTWRFLPASREWVHVRA